MTSLEVQGCFFYSHETLQWWRCYDRDDMTLDNIFGKYSTTNYRLAITARELTKILPHQDPKPEPEPEHVKENVDTFEKE